jgi:hypothetical protein
MNRLCHCSAPCTLRHRVFLKRTLTVAENTYANCSQYEKGRNRGEGLPRTSAEHRGDDGEEVLFAVDSAFSRLQIVAPIYTR